MTALSPKFILLTFVLLAAHSFAFSRQWQSMFGDSSTMWTRMVGGPTDIHTIYTVEYSAEKDTLVNGKLYKKIVHNMPPSEMDHFLLREELDSGFVYCIQLHTVDKQPNAPCKRDEFLYMDYNLQKGDTFSSLYPANFPPSMSRVVDSVYYQNGRKHIRFPQFYPDTLYEHLEIIEGIGFNFGNNYGFDCYYSFIKSETFMYCYWKDGVRQYSTPRSNHNCYPYTVFPPDLSVVDAARTPVAIYPNPASKEINIALPSKPVQQLTCQLYSVTGNLIINASISPGETLRKLDISQLSAGLYYIQLGSQRQLFSKQ